MHSTKELERQYEAAKSRTREAEIAEREARAKYHAALCADAMQAFSQMGGEVGKTRVRVLKQKAWGSAERIADMTRGPFVVVGASVPWSGARYTLRKLRKDGTPSDAPSGADTLEIVILPEDQPEPRP